MIPSFSNSQSLFERKIGITENNKLGLEISGYTRASAFGLSQQYDYSSVFAEFCLVAKLAYKNTFLFTDLRFRSGVDFDERYSLIQIKEVFAGYESNKLDLYLGNQIISWGRTDGFNPTNNITPNDYFFLSADNYDQKLANFMLRTKIHINSKIDIELIGIPIYAPSIYRFGLFDFGYYVDFSPIILPENTFNNSTIATRLNFEYSQIGFSLSYFRGWDPFYGFNIQSIDLDNLQITNSPTPYFKSSFGGDMSLLLGSWIIRTEFAYNKTNNYIENMQTPNPNINYVFGLEHKFFGIQTILQFIGFHTLHFKNLQVPIIYDPSNAIEQIQYAEDMILYESEIFNRKIFHQQKRNNYALSLMLNKGFAYNTLNIELNGYYNLTSEEIMINTKLVWKINDALEASLGGNYFTGPEKSVFHYSGPILSGIFIQLKASF
jgi:hypothetical protein